MKNKYGFIIGSLLFSSVSFASVITTTIYSTDNNKAPLGTVTFTDTAYGLLITPALHTLKPGAHGFHLHQHADCGDAGMHAGGHFDPQNSQKHEGPYGNGHLGDLPVLFILDGKANTPLLAPRLKTSDLSGLALMIHEGGDNYSDNPPLGGGGARIGCGIIQPADNAKL